MPSILVGGKRYDVRPDGVALNVKLGKGVRESKRMRKRETLQEFERRVQALYVQVQVSAPRAARLSGSSV